MNVYLLVLILILLLLFITNPFFYKIYKLILNIRVFIYNKKENHEP